MCHKGPELWARASWSSPGSSEVSSASIPQIFTAQPQLGTGGRGSNWMHSLSIRKVQSSEGGRQVNKRPIRVTDAVTEVSGGTRQ